MYKTDLQKEFVKALLRKVPKRAQLVNLLSDILHIEKEPASRRLSGKVLFTIHEMTALAQTFHISIDPLIHQKEDRLRIPLQLTSPMKIRSMNSLSTMIEANLSICERSEKGRLRADICTVQCPSNFFFPIQRFPSSCFLNGDTILSEQKSLITSPNGIFLSD
ncbi:MAG: hypothetical protein LIP05_08230 [Tannerellaceae bacterium]|nr:hypothetical protein [Tannerellaceae bacterium]